VPHLILLWNQFILLLSVGITAAGIINNLMTIVAVWKSYHQFFSIFSGKVVLKMQNIGIVAQLSCSSVGLLYRLLFKMRHKLAPLFMSL